MAFAACFFFFVSLLWSAFKIESYKTNPHRYLVISWCIFIIPSFVWLLFTISPYPVALRTSRHRISKMQIPGSYTPAINILNAVACLLAVVIYFYRDTLEIYADARWNSEMHYDEFLPIPSFVWIFDTDGIYRGDSNTTSKDPSFAPCMIYNMTDTMSMESCSQAMTYTTVGPYTAYVFDSSKLPVDSSTFNNLRTSVRLTQWIKCKVHSLATNY